MGVDQAQALTEECMSLDEVTNLGVDGDRNRRKLIEQ